MPNPIIQISEILKGYKVDRDNIQSVGNMTVIPIVGDIEFTNVADVNEVKLSRDPEYNKLEFRNSSGKVGIAMQGWALIDNKQHAQDRTLPYAHLIRAANAKVLPANCIQHTQPGHFDVSKVDHDSFMVLPPSLRGVALKNSSYKDSQVGALWDNLRTWIKGIDCDSNGLTSFFTQFEDRLDQFVAQFEPVEKQLGAIVLINGQVLAIDIVPKYESWKYLWRAFIRDSYGAEAVRQAKNEGAVNINPTIDFAEVTTLEDLANSYSSMKSGFYDQLQGLIGSVLSLSVTYSKLEEIGELTLVKIEGQEYVGQGVVHGADHFVYLSLVNSNAKAVPTQRFSSLRRDPYGSSTFRF